MTPPSDPIRPIPSTPSAAAQRGMVVEGKNDLVSVLQHLLELNEVHDDVIRLKWEDKARRYGTLNEVSQFPFGPNMAV